MCISKNKQNKKRQQHYSKPLRKLSGLSAGSGRLESAEALLRILQAPGTAGPQRALPRRRRTRTPQRGAGGALLWEPELLRFSNACCGTEFTKGNADPTTRQHKSSVEGQNTWNRLEICSVLGSRWCQQVPFGQGLVPPPETGGAPAPSARPGQRAQTTHKCTNCT